MDIKVLWIDDQPNDYFVDAAGLNGIYIETRLNVDDGIEELISSVSYDAIILDANCRYREDGKEPEISALMYALRKISEHSIKLPWFVYSGGGFMGEGQIDMAVKAYERPYDAVLWYKKPGQMNELFDKIKDVVSNSVEFKIRNQYSNEFEAASLIPEAEKLLIEGLLFEYKGTHQNVQDYFNPIRKIFERIVSDLKQRRILPKISSLNGIQRLLANGSDFVDGFRLKKPIMEKPLAHSLKYFLDITQDGSHDDCDLQLGVDSYVRSRNNVNLFRSILYITMDLLLWYQEKIEAKETDNYECNFIYIGKVCTTMNGSRMVYYTGKYQLQPTDVLIEGCTVGIKQTQPSNRPFGSITDYVFPKYYIIIED